MRPPGRGKYDANGLKLYTHTKMSKIKTQWEKVPILPFTLNFRGFWPNFQGVWAQFYPKLDLPWQTNSTNLFVLKISRFVQNFRKKQQTVTEKVQCAKWNTPNLVKNARFIKILIISSLLLCNISFLFFIYLFESNSHKKQSVW